MMLNKLSLNTIGLNRIGLNRIGKPSRGSSGRPYIDPEVLASLKAVCICYGKSNDDPDRAIVKNLVDPDNPFIISNAAYKLNSGYGKYEEDFTTWVGAAISINNGAGFKIERNNTGWWGFSTYGVKATNEFKIKVTNCRDAFSWRYKDAEGIWQTMNITKDGIYTLPASQERDEHDAPRFFNGNPNATYNGLTVEQIPSYQGAFVTDGVNDLITSTKTIGQMVGENGDYTIISMIHQISYTHETAGDYDFALTNYIRSGDGYTRSRVTNIGKTAIYGYYANPKNSDAPTYNNILGDKADLFSETNAMPTIYNDKISIQGYVRSDGLMDEFSELAWYWTILAKGQLTTDQINQVIAYFNLDRCVEPTVLYDVKRQGLSNDTPDSDWYLKDFSKNGFDMSLFNFAKKGNSGVGKYEADFLSWSYGTGLKSRTHDTFLASTDQENNPNVIIGIVNYTATPTSSDIDSFVVDVKIEGEAYLSYFYVGESDTNTRSRLDIKSSGRYTIPKSYNSNAEVNISCGFYIGGLVGTVEVTQIPSHAGALCFDGVEDYGQFVGDLGLKDYTVVVDRAYEEAITNAVPILSSIDFRSDIPFLFEFATDVVRPYSFGVVSITNEPLDINRLISYQSTYSYNGKAINKGVSSDIGNGLTFGKFGSENRQYAKLALWSLLLFPYSLSEFLIERQLKKHELGTLYPDMVELRPIIKGGSIFKYLRVSDNKTLYPGDYINVGDTIRFYVSDISGTPNEVSKFTVNGIEGTPKGNNGDLFDVVVTTSPQKIDITIDEYIRYEDIVQPYPMFFEFYNENNELFTWGGKVKVGSTITRTKGVAYSNLLEGLYTITNPRLNGVQLAGAEHTVEKQMVFTCDATYIKGSNAPKCILSPSRLRIPNSSYKILGYIPDISGHGNHGKINNSAYAGMSGANGYKYDWNTWSIVGGSNVERTDSLFTNKLAITTPTWGIIPPTNTAVDTFKIKVEGLKTGNIYWNYRIEGEDSNKQFYIYNDGEYELPASIFASAVGFILSPGTNAGVIVKQIGEYEGAYCLDGVDDFITIPTLSSGGKQVLMKVNWGQTGTILYDQRATSDEFAIYTGDSNTALTSIAYDLRNNGKTYIDGILNENILTSILKGIKHNITITNALSSGVRPTSPRIGITASGTNYGVFRFYDFMLFDEISTDEEILTLNEYVGIEGNTDDLFTENN